jgi:(4S)-4-hydroxy-5-phosphonooxypentane-2,3-dione isomerase
MIVTIVNVHVKSENIEQFIKATIENHNQSTQEAGNLRFDVLQHKDNPSMFSLYEAYESAEASADHKKTSHYLKWKETVEPWMAEPRKGIAHTIIAPADKKAWKR